MRDEEKTQFLCTKKKRYCEKKRKTSYINKNKSSQQQRGKKNKAKGGYRMKTEMRIIIIIIKATEEMIKMLSQRCALF